jgi:hypothetical protein
VRNDHHPLGPVFGMPVPATGLTGFIPSYLLPERRASLSENNHHPIGPVLGMPVSATDFYLLLVWKERIVILWHAFIEE